ncbi:MAG: helix-turn-helix domain-containing protein [Ekhidna sp.]
MPEFNAFQLIIILGLVNGLILLFSLSSLPKKFKRPAKILGWFILGYTAYVSNWTIFASLGYHYHVTPLWIPSLFFLPGLTYLFSKSITSSSPFIRSDIFFLVPGILDSVFQLGKWVWYLQNHEGYYFPMDDRTEFFIYEGIGLLFASFCIYKITRLIKKASLKRNDAFKFYRYAFFFLLFVLIRWMIMYLIDYFNPAILTFELQFTFWSVDLLFFLFLGYRSLVAPAKYVSQIPIEKNSDMSQEAQELIAVLEDEKLYLNPEFSRKHLGDRLQLSDVKISNIIGNQLDTTFYELVNEMRVREAKLLLNQGLSSTLTLEAIAQRAGFKSKTTFYKFFKNKLGMNPREYLKSQTSQSQ